MTVRRAQRWHFVLIIALFTLFSHGAIAQQCNARVVFANGIVTLRTEARDIRDTLRDDINQALQDEGRAELPFYCFDYAYASTREQADDLAYFIDLLEAVRQIIGDFFGPFWRWLGSGDIPQTNLLGQLVQDVFIGVGNISFLTNSDLQTQVGQYRSWLDASDKVIIVAHSQGNLFANEAFVVLTSGADGNSVVPSDRLPIVAVATPDSFVAGRPSGSHTTLYGDIIRVVVTSLLANTPIDGTPCNPTPPDSQLPDPVNGLACHNFVKSYLAGTFSRPRIIDQIIDEIPNEDSGYLITDLGELPGGSLNSRAYAIDNFGIVVGQAEGAADSDYGIAGRTNKPFIWTAASGMQALGPSPSYQTLTPQGGIAWGINDQGTVVGTLDYGFAGRFRSFIWTTDDGMQLIPAGPGSANDVNNSEQVVGSGGVSAFRWTAIGGIESLGIPAQRTFANAINSVGEVAGAAGIESCNTGPVIWNADRQPHSLNLAGLLATLPPYRFICNGHASGINDNGDAVGSVFIEFISGDRGVFAFGWSAQNNVAQALDALPQINPGDPSTEAFGINNLGMVVGASNSRAFLWTPEAGIVDFNSLLDESGTGWILYSADAINDLGEIVGYGLHNGVTRSFLLTPNGSIPP